MHESEPHDSAQEKSDDKEFWDSFFVYLDRMRDLGIEIDQDKVIEIAKIADIEAAQRLLLYSILHGQPKKGRDMSVIGEIIDFLTKREYLDFEEDAD